MKGSGWLPGLPDLSLAVPVYTHVPLGTLTALVVLHNAGLGVTSPVLNSGFVAHMLCDLGQVL